MSLKNRLFSKDTRRSSTDLSSNLYHAIRKLCKDKPIRLSQLKVEYDRYFKDKISTKSSDIVTAALKSLDGHVISVKVYVQVDNREMTDTLLGLRSASYAPNMLSEDNPQISKERLLAIIREEGILGVHVRELEERYVSFYGTKPSHLPFKSIKELLHRTPDVELASSGKSLRVRIRQLPIPVKKTPGTKIPSLNRSSLTASLPYRIRKNQDYMSMSVCRPSESSLLRERSDMTRSVFVPSAQNSSDETSAPSSGSGSPNGSIDMHVSMVVPKSRLLSCNTEKLLRRSSTNVQDCASVVKQNKEVMATILNDLPAEGMSLKALNEEFRSIIGRDLPYGTTIVGFLTSEFKDVVKLSDGESGLRVFKTNSPLLPRRSIADVYTKLALQSNRRPSDRVLKVLKDIYKKNDQPQQISEVKEPPVKPPRKSLQQESLATELLEKLSVSRIPTRIPARESLSNQDPLQQLKRRLAQGPVDYPEEFKQLTKEIKEDTQSLLVQLMSSLNLCLKPINGKMVLQMNK